MNKVVRAIQIGMPISAAIVFYLWLSKQESPFSLGTISAWISLFLFTLTLIAALSRLTKRLVAPKPLSLTAPDTRREPLTA